MSVKPAAVVLDLGGVVFRHHPDRRLDAFARLTGTTAEQVRRSLFDSGYSTSCDAGRLTTDRAYREGVRLLGTRMSLARFRALWISSFEPDNDVVALAQRLKPLVSLALLTNNSTLVREGLEARYPEILDLFRPRLFSADVGQLKPAPGLFHTLLDLLGTTADRVLFVDDTPANVDAAAALGFRTHRFEGADGLARTLAAEGVL
jgi:HAD superfamily hydrolase (TIGR01509 family)